MTPRERWQAEKQCDCHHPNKFRCGFVKSGRSDVLAECRCACHVRASRPRIEGPETANTAHE